MSIETQIAIVQQLVEWIQKEGVQWGGAITLLLAGWYFSKFVAQSIRPLIGRRFHRASTVNVVLRAVRALIIAIVFVFAANFVGYRPENVFLSATVLTATVGYILAPIISSFISGFFVLLNRPYEIGDLIELVDREQQGYIEDINLRYTKIFTLDNTLLLLPNDRIRQRDFVNYSAEDERTRRSIEVLVTYESDITEARALLEKAAQDVEEVITDGPEIRIGSIRYPAAPEAYIAEFADHGILLELRFWVRRPYLPRIVRSKVNTNIWEAIEEVDVEIPYPHMHHIFDETSGQARVAVESWSEGNIPGRSPGD